MSLSRRRFLLGTTAAGVALATVDVEPVRRWWQAFSFGPPKPAPIVAGTDFLVTWHPEQEAAIDSLKKLDAQVRHVALQPHVGDLIFDADDGGRPIGVVSSIDHDGLARVATSGMFNVKDFGALGNGRTDDSAAIQAAIGRALQMDRPTATLYFPPGDYQVGALTLPSGISLRGAGEDVSNINMPVDRRSTPRRRRRA